MMGSGKTSWAIQEMDVNKEKRYIFVTPFLNEIERIKHDTKVPFYEPMQKGEGKLNSFHELLTENKNIAVTHRLFTMMTDETCELIKKGNYTLIIDEVLDVLDTYNEKVGNIIHMKNSKIIDVDEDGYVLWKEEVDCTEDYDFHRTKMSALNKCLVVYSDTIFLWQFPVDVFHSCEEVYVMTFGFDGSVLNAYFNIHNLNYIKKQITHINNKYSLIDYTDKIQCPYDLKKLITICDDKKLNEIGNYKTALSVGWYEKHPNEIKTLKDNITNYLKNKMKCSSRDVMWTTYSGYEDKLSASGRKFTHKLDTNENQRYHEQVAKGRVEQEMQKLKCFIPCNSRATNIYSDRSVLVYAINYYPNTIIKNYFSMKEVNLDSDQYALNGLIQWIWRSRIRNGESISIYIPSRRMRTLFQQWIDFLERKSF